MSRIIHVFFVSCFLLQCCSNTRAQSTDAKIRKKIFLDYDHAQPPTPTQDGPISLDVRLQLTDFTVNGGYYTDTTMKLSIKGSLLISWFDNRFQWDPLDFQRVSTILLHKEELWYPDSGFENKCTDNKCIVSSNGKVSCVPDCSFDAQCDNNAIQWPFETVTCRLRLGSWDRPNAEYSVSSYNTVAIAQHGISNHMWQIVSITDSTTRNTSKLHDKTFTLLCTNFIIQRHTKSFMITITIPALVMVSLNLLSLWIPIDSNMRYAVLLVVVHAHIIYIQQMSWMAPKTGTSAPLVLIFFRDSLFLTTFLLVFITVTKRLAMRQYPTPRWIDPLLNFIDSQPWASIFFPVSNGDSMKAFNETTDDSASLNPVAATYNNQWQWLTLILERMCFYILLVTYSILLMCFIPSYSISPGDSERPKLLMLENLE